MRRWWAATTPALLLQDGTVYTQPNSPVRTYDISPDGQRFVVLKAAAEAGAGGQVVVIQHLDELLKRLLAGT